MRSIYFTESRFMQQSMCKDAEQVGNKCTSCLRASAPGTRSSRVHKAFRRQIGQSDYGWFAAKPIVLSSFQRRLSNDSRVRVTILRE